MTLGVPNLLLCEQPRATASSAAWQRCPSLAKPPPAAMLEPLLGVYSSLLHTFSLKKSLLVPLCPHSEGGQRNGAWVSRHSGAGAALPTQRWKHPRSFLLQHSHLMAGEPTKPEPAAPSRATLHPTEHPEVLGRGRHSSVHLWAQTAAKTPWGIAGAAPAAGTRGSSSTEFGSVKEQNCLPDRNEPTNPACRAGIVLRFHPTLCNTLSLPSAAPHALRAHPKTCAHAVCPARPCPAHRALPGDQSHNP